MAGRSPPLAARSSGVAPTRQDGIRAAIVPQRAIRRKQFQLQIGIGARGKQHLDELQTAGLIQRGPVGPAAHRQGIQIHRRVQGRAAPGIPVIHIDAALDQEAPRCRNGS